MLKLHIAVSIKHSMYITSFRKLLVHNYLLIKNKPTADATA